MEAEHVDRAGGDEQGEAEPRYEPPEVRPLGSVAELTGVISSSIVK